MHRAGDPVREGDVLGGRFRVDRRLGSGGMGVVFRATNLALGQIVALKFLFPYASAENVQRFLREARATARMSSEHIARVLDLGRLDSNVPFIIMEYLDGETLAAMLVRRAPLPAAEVADIALQICAALAEAHARGIVHRDIKPANVFMARRTDGRTTVKVLDFGIAKIVADAEDPGLTTDSSVIGSPSFAAPEQLLRPREVDARADQWGLGITLYKMLSNVLPFAGETTAEVYMKVLGSTPVPIDELRPDVPAPLAAALMRCLEKDAAARFADIGALAAELEPFVPSGAKGAAAAIAESLSSPPESDDLAANGSEMILEFATATDITRIESRPPIGAQEPLRAIRRHRGAAAATAILAIGLIAFVSIRSLRASGAPASVAGSSSTELVVPPVSPPMAPSASMSSSAASLPSASATTSATARASHPRAVNPSAATAKRDPRGYR